MRVLTVLKWVRCPPAAAEKVCALEEKITMVSSELLILWSRQNKRKVERTVVWAINKDCCFGFAEKPPLLKEMRQKAKSTLLQAYYAL